MKIKPHHKDLFSTLLNQTWRLISGPLTILLVPLFLTETEQGYWYLFGSLAALSIFADLGFSNIILQFSAHEFAFLSFNKKGLLEGDEKHLVKIGTFLRFTLKWVCSICMIVFPFIYIVGIWFFVRDNVLGQYIVPWTIFSFASLVNFISTAVLSYVEGMNKISKIQKVRFRAAVINTLVICSVLILGGNIYALVLGSFLSVSSVFISIFGEFKAVLHQVLMLSKSEVYHWRKEVLPLFSRYAISFSSGYFIFLIYTPLMQYFHGPVHSGKVGITLALVTAIFSMSNIWIYTVTPQMNMFAAHTNKDSWDLLFQKRLLFSIGTYAFISLCMFIFVIIFKDFWIMPKIISRFLPVQSVLMLLTCYFLQLIINSLATYLRAHKKEPYMVPSIIVAVWVALSTAYSGHSLSTEYFFVGFLSSYLWWLPLSFIIYKQSQRKWYGR